MLKFSKGPWSEEATMSSDFRFIRYINDRDGRVIAEVRYAKDAEQDENLGNADLIVSAPQMLGLLQKLANNTLSFEDAQKEAQSLLLDLDALTPPMQVMELVLQGFDGGTDETDDRIVTVGVPILADLSEEDQITALRNAIADFGILPLVEAVSVLHIPFDFAEIDFSLPGEMPMLVANIKEIMGVATA